MEIHMIGEIKQELFSLNVSWCFFPLIVGKQFYGKVTPIVRQGFQSGALAEAAFAGRVLLENHRLRYRLGSWVRMGGVVSTPPEVLHWH